MRHRSDCLAGIVVAANHKLGGHRKLLSSQTESLFGYIVGYALNFDYDTSRGNRRNESLGITFTFTHTYLGRLLGDRLVREYADPYLALTLHIACHCDTRGLDLTAGDPLRLKSLYTEGAESELMASLGLAFHAALLRATEFRFFRL